MRVIVPFGVVYQVSHERKKLSCCIEKQKYQELFFNTISLCELKRREQEYFPKKTRVHNSSFVSIQNTYNLSPFNFIRYFISTLNRYEKIHFINILETHYSSKFIKFSINFPQYKKPYIQIYCIYLVILISRVLLITLFYPHIHLMEELPSLRLASITDNLFIHAPLSPNL